MTMPYPQSPNEPGQAPLPSTHEPGPQRIHEPMPVQPVHPVVPEEPTTPDRPDPAAPLPASPENGAPSALDRAT